ncbi:hypothetical protein [Rhizomonospora bruguierae]|nr:hypothetical protein [Micromonospora sp. NBRC 107566]
MTTEIIPAAEAEKTAAPLLDGGSGLMVSTALLVLIGVIVIILIAS